jgi:hypothetical protein
MVGSTPAPEELLEIARTVVRSAAETAHRMRAEGVAAVATKSTATDVVTAADRTWSIRSARNVSPLGKVWWKMFSWATAIAPRDTASARAAARAASTHTPFYGAGATQRVQSGSSGMGRRGNGASLTL